MSSSLNNQYQPDQDPVGICNRCKSKPGIVICNQCTPYNIFCFECDQTVHSYPSKMNHEREKIFCNTQPQLNQSQNNTFFSSEKDLLAVSITVTFTVMSSLIEEGKAWL